MLLIYLFAILSAIYASQTGASGAFIRSRSIDPVRWDTQEILLRRGSGNWRNALLPRGPTRPRTRQSNRNKKAKSPSPEQPQQKPIQQQAPVGGSSRSPTPLEQLQGENLAWLPESSTKSNKTPPATQEVKQRRPIRTRPYATNPINPDIVGWGSRKLRSGIVSKTANEADPATAALPDDKDVSFGSRLEKRGRSPDGQGQSPDKRGRSSDKRGASPARRKSTDSPSPKRPAVGASKTPQSMKDLDHALASYQKIYQDAPLPGKLNPLSGVHKSLSPSMPVPGHNSMANMPDQLGQSMVDLTRPARSGSSHGSKQSGSPSSREPMATAKRPKKDKKKAAVSPTNQNAQRRLGHGWTHDNQDAVGTPHNVGIGFPHNPFQQVAGEASTMHPWIDPGPIVTLPARQNSQHEFSHDNFDWTHNNQYSMAPVQPARGGGSTVSPARHSNQATAFSTSQNSQLGSSPSYIGRESEDPLSMLLTPP